MPIYTSFHFIRDFQISYSDSEFKALFFNLWSTYCQTAIRIDKTIFQETKPNSIPFFMTFVLYFFS